MTAAGETEGEVGGVAGGAHAAHTKCFLSTVCCFPHPVNTAALRLLTWAQRDEPSRRSGSLLGSLTDARL